MTQTLDKREDPLNLGGGWASSAPFRTRSSCHRRRRGARIYKQRHHYGPEAEYEPSQKLLKQQHGPGPWFQPPQSPYWAMYSNWGRWGGPWCPPPMGYRMPPGPVQVTRMYALHPVCLCCCTCSRGPWNPGWARPPGRKKRWGHPGRGLRHHSRRPIPKSPPEDVRKLLQPVDLCRRRAPGMRAPRNTTQFIMNQIYEDMRQQEEREREQAARRAQQAQEGGNDGNDAPPSGGEEDADLQDILYGFVQNSSLALSPDPAVENLFPAPQLVEEEEEETNDDECDGKEDEESESQYEEEVEETDYVEDEEEDEEKQEEDDDYDEEEDDDEEKEEEEAEKIEEEEGRLEEDEQRE